MFCTKCGKEVKDGLKFCPNCGAPLSQNHSSMNNVNNANTMAGVGNSSRVIDLRKNDKKSGAPGSNRKKNKKTIIVLIIILCVLLAISLAGFALIKSGIISISVEGDQRQESSIDKDKKDDKSPKKDSDKEKKNKKDKKDKKKDGKEKKDKKGDEKKESKKKKNKTKTDNKEKEENSTKSEEPTTAIPRTMPTVTETETMPTVAVVNDEFILPDSNTRVLSHMDLQNLTPEQCRLARNELYARHGRMFDDPNLQSYFQSKSWYYGTIPADEFSDSMLSDIEIQNRNLIVDYEKEMGYTK